MSWKGEDLTNAHAIWRWRDFTVIGKIQIDKTFVTPIFVYRASLICLDHKVVRNSIIVFSVLFEKVKIKVNALFS